MSSQQLTAEKREQLIGKTRPFVLFSQMFNSKEQIYLPVASVSRPTNQLEPSLMALETNGFTNGNAPPVSFDGRRMCVSTSDVFSVDGVGSGGRNQAVCLPVSACSPLLNLCVIVNAQRTNFTHHQWLGCKFS